MFHSRSFLFRICHLSSPRYLTLPTFCRFQGAGPVGRVLHTVYIITSASYYSQMSVDDAKIVHLYNLAHYQCLNPLSSSHALDSDTVLSNAGLRNPRLKSSCDACGIFLIPGITSSTRIKYTKTRQGRTRSLTTKCLVCFHIRRENCLLDRKRIESPKTGANASKSKKKKKRGDLASLIDQKKQQLGNGGLDLFNFM